jgi:hypothetical protein
LPIGNRRYGKFAICSTGLGVRVWLGQLDMRLVFRNQSCSRSAPSFSSFMCPSDWTVAPTGSRLCRGLAIRQMFDSGWWNGFADWQSAIRQIDNLRYKTGGRFEPGFAHSIAKVCLRPPRLRACSANRPRTESIWESSTVARLSVMSQESRRRPDAFPVGEARGMAMRLG